MDKDDYILSVNVKGDEGSEILIAECAPTLRNRDEIEIISDGMNGLAVINVPHGKVPVIYSVSGDHSLLDPVAHTVSMMRNAAEAAAMIGAEPIALADVVDSATGDIDMIASIAKALRYEGDRLGIAIPTGENAILGKRVNCAANVIGTAIAFLDKENVNSKDFLETGRSRFIINGVNYSLHDAAGKKLKIGSDGIGTKSECYERARKYPIGLKDLIAMQADDSAKDGARIIESSNIVEMSGNIPIDLMRGYADMLEEKLGFPITLTFKNATGRIMGYKPGAATYNASGSTISIVDEKRLTNPLRPYITDILLSVTPKITGPRSNGVSLRRECIEDMLGKEWHDTRIGKEFLDFMTIPSTIFYPMFMDLIDSGIATSVYHMSGGAFNGKLARPIAKNGLYVEIEGEKLFKPDWRESALVGRALYPAEKAYSAFPMGNEAFISVPYSKICPARNIIETKYGYQTSEVGRFEKNPFGLTGITLKGIKGSDGKTDVYFSGK